VKIYTSGSDGEHWFYAMELINGRPLTEFAAEQKLSIREKQSAFA
jgi:hypothetical protein